MLRISPESWLIGHYSLARQPLAAFMEPPQWESYRQWLSEIKRWQNGIPCRQPGFSENVLEHTEGAIALLYELLEGRPHLQRFIHVPLVANTLWLHDAGEHRRGDVARTDQHYEATKAQQDRDERACFCDEVLPLLPASVQAEAYRLFAGFQNGDKHPDFAFARWLDDLHGARTAVMNFYHMVPSDPTFESQLQSFEKHTMTRVHQGLVDLEAALRRQTFASPMRAILEVRAMLNDEIVFYQRHGCVYGVAQYYAHLAHR